MSVAHAREFGSDADKETVTRAYFRLYSTIAGSAISAQFQHRLSQYMYMAGMVIEPVVYLVVWQTVARHQGGEIAGYSADTFAAYYIVWTLVRNINFVFTPFGWESRIKEGEISGHLLRPMHPIHFDVALFLGRKVVVVVLWLPVAAFLLLMFRPNLNPRATQVLAFVLALLGAYLIRSLWLWALGLVTFWTIRVRAIFEAYFAAELVLSGRLVPLALMPGWVQRLSDFLPFSSCFGFPITALVGPVTDRSLALGLARQLIWMAAGATLVALIWRRAVARFTAVSG